VFTWLAVVVDSRQAHNTGLSTKSNLSNRIEKDAVDGWPGGPDRNPETLPGALACISRRFSDISDSADVYAGDAGIDRMDALCMMRIAAGEELISIG